jgi:hypothetical protein
VSKPNEIDRRFVEALLIVKLYAKRMEDRYLVSDAAGAKLELMHLLRAAMCDLVAIETQERCNEADSTT